MPQQTHPASSGDVLDYWYGELGEDAWFRKDTSVDETIERRFLTTWQAAASGDLDDWQATPEGALALIIVLDQFPRNMFRNDPRAFSTDANAREVAGSAIAAGYDMKIPEERRVFFYLPHEHSENLADQKLCVEWMRTRTQKGSEYEAYAKAHHDIIARFGRFPHRNDVLGRKSTPEEIAFLKEPGSSF